MVLLFRLSADSGVRGSANTDEQSASVRVHGSVLMEDASRILRLNVNVFHTSALTALVQTQP
jgi:hypothetical protein